MASYILSKAAEQDLRDIARYTLNRWGHKQLAKYRSALKQKFEAIGRGELVVRKFSANLPDIYIAKAGAHFIFYITPNASKPMSIAVLHEARDVVQHLATRFGDQV